jgi:hypothetical protein
MCRRGHDYGCSRDQKKDPGGRNGVGSRGEGRRVAGASEFEGARERGVGEVTIGLLKRMGW